MLPILTKVTPHSSKLRLFNAAKKNTKIWTSLLWLSGGKLNPTKCFHYYIHPKYNFRKHTTEYLSEKQAPGSILLTDHATGLSTLVECLEPTCARRILGVLLANNDNGKQQIKLSLDKACTFLGKIKHSNLSKQAKWMAITSIMEPEVHCPLVATLSKQNDLNKVERIITRAKCNALNEHFPRAIIYGSM
jgi:hypothetical protein